MGFQELLLLNRNMEHKAVKWQKMLHRICFIMPWLLKRAAAASNSRNYKWWLWLRCWKTGLQSNTDNYSLLKTKTRLLTQIQRKVVEG